MRALFLFLLSCSFGLTLSSQAGVFGDIEFGDGYTAVQNKLMKSELADTDLPETLLGRTGINGVFKTTRTLDGQRLKLFFTFENDSLTEIQLRTDSKASINSAIGLVEEASKELDKIHGKAAQSGQAPKANQLPVGASMLYRVWHPGDGGSALVGLTRDKDGFSAIICLKRKRIELQKTP